jgi:hypothetical protein
MQKQCDQDCDGCECYNKEDYNETPVMEEEPEPAEEQYVDSISVEASGLIKTENVLSIELPKVSVETINGVITIEKSPILFTLHDNKGVCSDIIKATKNGLKEIVITTYLDLEKTIISDIWKFSGPKIKGINFGQVITLLNSERRVVQCEVEFDKLTINDVEF